MKDIHRKFYILGVFMLLVLSCSLLKPTVVTNENSESPATRDKSANLTRSVLRDDTTYCLVSTGYEDGLVNLRAGAGVTFEVLLVLPENTRLEVLEESDWFKVKTTDGIAGYINSKYCKLGE